MQLYWGSSESVMLPPKVEFETFHTTQDEDIFSTDYDSVFERKHAFTHRNFMEEDNHPYANPEKPGPYFYQCHNFWMKFETENYLPVHGDMEGPNPAEHSGFSNVFGIKYRNMFFPPVQD